MDIIEFFKSGLAGKGTYERGILKEMTMKAREEAGDYPLYYTEWNTSAMTNDSKHDECYASAMIAKTLADNDGLVQGYSYWTFTDIFEESAQIPGAFHGGFGLQTYAGIAKPAYRLFELFHGLGTKRLKVESDGRNGTVEMLATETENGYRLAVYNHTIPEEPIKNEEVKINVRDMVSEKDVTVYRIDEDHANAKKFWIKMGSPEYLKPELAEKLKEASLLKAEKIMCDGTIILTVPAHGVAVIDL